MATHIPPLPKSVSCTSSLQGQHVCQILFENASSHNFWHNMPLPWQHTFLHCRKMCLAQLHHTANMCAKFPFKSLKNIKVVQSAKFSPFFLAMICHYHGNTLSAIVKKCVLHISISRPTCGPNFTLNALKMWK